MERFIWDIVRKWDPEGLPVLVSPGILAILGLPVHCRCMMPMRTVSDTTKEWTVPLELICFVPAAFGWQELVRVHFAIAMDPKLTAVQGCVLVILSVAPCGYGCRLGCVFCDWSSDGQVPRSV